VVAAFCIAATTNRLFYSGHSERTGMIRNLFAAIITAMLGACATATPVPEHTLFVGEVVAIAESHSGADGFDYQGEFLRFPQELFEACGVSRAADRGVDLALLRYSYYWHNGGAPVHENLRWYPIRSGVELSPGNLVEVDLMVGAQGPDSRCPWVSRKLAEDLAGAGCQYLSAPQGGIRQTLSLISPIGGPGSASLDCPALLDAGWRRQAFGLYGSHALVRDPGASPAPTSETFSRP
jgi:hypothetical protein